MAYPLAHTAVGYTVCKLGFSDDSYGFSYKDYAWVAFLSSLPDLDVIPGLLLYGNGAVFHRGISHSIIFILFVSLITSQFWKPGQVRRQAKVFMVAFSLLLSHLLIDMIGFSQNSLWWPLQPVYTCTPMKSLFTVGTEVVSVGLREVVICLTCMSALAVKKYFKRVPIKKYYY